MTIFFFNPRSSCNTRGDNLGNRSRSLQRRKILVSIQSIHQLVSQLKRCVAWIFCGQGGLSTGHTAQIEHTCLPVYLTQVCCSLIGFLMVCSEFLLCHNSAQRFNEMDEVNISVKFIFIVGDIACLQNASITVHSKIFRYGRLINWASTFCPKSEEKSIKIAIVFNQFLLTFFNGKFCQAFDKVTFLLAHKKHKLNTYSKLIHALDGLDCNKALCF